MEKFIPGNNRRKKRQQERRNSIIRAATRLVCTKGYRQTTMQDIAEAADLSTSSVYYYFESKIAIIEEAVNIFVAEVTKIDENAANSEALRENLVSSFLDRLDYFKDYNLLTILAEAEREPELRPRLLNLFQSLRQELRNRIRVLQETHTIEVENPDLVADMILSMGFGALAISNLQKAEGSAGVDVKRMLDGLNALIFNQHKPSKKQENQ